MNLNVFLAGVLSGTAFATMMVMYYVKLPWWSFLPVLSISLFAVLYNLSIKGIEIGKVKE